MSHLFIIYQTALQNMAERGISKYAWMPRMGKDQPLRLYWKNVTKTVKKLYFLIFARKYFNALWTPNLNENTQKICLYEYYNVL